MTGQVSNDNLEIGGFVVPGIDFAEATTEPGTAFLYGKFDGIFGLAYDTLAVGHVVPPFYDMVNRKLVQEPIFTFRMGSTESDGGEVVFGGVDTDHYTGELEFYPVNHKGYWQIGLKMITMGGLVSNYSKKMAILAQVKHRQLTRVAPVPRLTPERHSSWFPQNTRTH